MKKIFTILILLGLTASVYSWNTGGGFEQGSDLNMGKNKITGDSSTGIYFDSDNDGTVEITMTAEGGISASSMTVTDYYTDNLNVTYGVAAATGVFSGALSAATLNTGQGANELYAMNQDVESTDAVTFTTLNTGQGANELYDMNQNVQTTDTVTFAEVKTSTISAQGADGLYLVDDGDNGIFIKDGGNVGIGTTNPLKRLHVIGNTAIRTDTGGLDGQAGIILDANYTSATRASRLDFFQQGNNKWTIINDYYQNNTNDLRIRNVLGNNLRILQNGNVGIGGDTLNPAQKLEVEGIVKSSGVYARGGDGLELYDDGNNGIFIKDGGNVGIGTTDPVAKLDIIQSGTVPGLQISGGTNPYIKLTNATVINKLQIIDSSNIGTVGTEGAHRFDINTANTARISITGAGNVGIGTSAPVGLFQVGKGTMTILSNGNIGLGSLTPTAKLDIVGDVKVSGITHNSYVFAGSSIAATTSITNTFTEVIDGESEWTILGSSATYTGTNDRVVQVFAHGCCDSSAATDATFALFQNGVQCDYCEEHYDIANNEHQSIGIQGIFSVATNDVISLQVTTDDGDDINMDRVNISIIQVN